MCQPEYLYALILFEGFKTVEALGPVPQNEMRRPGVTKLPGQKKPLLPPDFTGDGHLVPAIA